MMPTCIVIAIDWTGQSNTFMAVDLEGVLDIKICQRDCPDPWISVEGPTTLRVISTGEPTPIDFAHPQRVLAITVAASETGVQRLSWYPRLTAAFDFVNITA